MCHTAGVGDDNLLTGFPLLANGCQRLLSFLFFRGFFLLLLLFYLLTFVIAPPPTPERMQTGVFRCKNDQGWSSSSFISMYGLNVFCCFFCFFYYWEKRKLKFLNPSQKIPRIFSQPTPRPPTIHLLRPVRWLLIIRPIHVWCMNSWTTVGQRFSTFFKSRNIYYL